MNDLEKAFDWQQIQCPEFTGILWHNTETAEYRHNNVLLEKSDPRLILYLKACSTMKPVNFDLTLIKGKQDGKNI